MALPDRGVDDAERARRLEAEPLVVAGVAQQSDQREPSCLGTPKELCHESATDARALVKGRHRQRGDGDRLLPTEITATSHDMADDDVVDNGDQFELGHDCSHAQVETTMSSSSLASRSALVNAPRTTSRMESWSADVAVRMAML